MVDEVDTRLSSPNLLWVAAEASADQHASRVIHHLVKEKGMRVFGIGGDTSQRAGMEVLFDAQRMAVLGLVEVIKHLFFFKKVMKTLKVEVALRKPKAACLMDYPGFNFPLMEYLYRQKVPVVYYICPQLWAWGKKRIKPLATYTQARIVLFPFEVNFYAKHGVEVFYWGHPLMEVIPPPEKRPDGDVLALLPGSRFQEVKRHLPVMLEVVKEVARDYRLRIFPSPILAKDTYGVFLSSWQGKEIEILHSFEGVRAALVASGTASLECALHGIPSVVIYRLNPLSLTLLKGLVSSPYISIVNILLNKPVFPEFLQPSGRSRKLKKKLMEVLEKPSVRTDIFEACFRLREHLGPSQVTEKLTAYLNQLVA